MKPIKYICLIIILALVAAATGWAGQSEHERLRKQATQAYHDGNWKDHHHAPPDTPVFEEMDVGQLRGSSSR